MGPISLIIVKWVHSGSNSNRIANSLFSLFCTFDDNWLRQLEAESIKNKSNSAFLNVSINLFVDC